MLRLRASLLTARPGMRVKDEVDLLRSFRWALQIRVGAADTKPIIVYEWVIAYRSLGISSCLELAEQGACDCARLLACDFALL